MKNILKFNLIFGLVTSAMTAFGVNVIDVPQLAGTNFFVSSIYSRADRYSKAIDRREFKSIYNALIESGVGVLHYRQQLILIIPHETLFHKETELFSKQAKEMTIKSIVNLINFLPDKTNIVSSSFYTYRISDQGISMRNIIKGQTERLMRELNKSIANSMIIYNQYPMNNNDLAIGEGVELAKSGYTRLVLNLSSR